MSTLSTDREAVPRGAAAGTLRRLIPAWLVGYRRSWLTADVVAAVVIWSVVVPQAVAYAQIAGLPPQAGLVAAPGALVGYAILGSSRALVVSATTATSAVSAAAVGAVAGGDTARFAALSAGFALAVALVLVAAGALRLGAVADLVSKPVMTGFLFGLGVSIAVGQLPKLLGVAGGDGNSFEKLWAVLGQLGEASGWTAAVGLASVLLLVALRRAAPAVPATLLVLVLAIAVSAALDLASRGVDVVGSLPSAYPQPAWPDVSLRDAVDLLPAAFGVLLLVTTEAFGVARAVAATDGSRIDPNRELLAIGGANLLAGLSPGFVQSGGASQTMAAERAGGKTQLASVVAAGLILLTGAFLVGIFEDLPQATLGAIVIVAIAGFWRVDELVRFARLRRSAVVLALVALAGVLAFGVLPGLIVAAALSLVVVIQRLSRPRFGLLARDTESGAWGRVDGHPDWATVPSALVGRVEGPLFYANALTVKEGLLAAIHASDPPPAVFVLDLAQSSDLDVESLDMLADLQAELAAGGIELRLAEVRARALAMLRRGGLAAHVRIEPTIDAALAHSPEPPS